MTVDLEASNKPLSTTLIIKLMLLVGCWLLVFWQPLLSAASVWWVNDTYMHCFFIVPAAFYMMWHKRSQWLPLAPRPFWWALIPLLLALLLSLTGVVADVQFFQHVGMFASLPLMITLVTGWRVALSVAFPLCFMMFSVPVGDELIPLFQSITADMSVYMIQLSGVPVYNTGWFIEIPAGRFIVAEACSGVRFFIASVVFAAIYAYVSFNDTPRRIAYGLLGIFLPIIANGIRVYGTIMVAHVFGMEYAEGADHLVYGWVFFSLVIILLIIIGEFMRPNIASSPAADDYPVAKEWYSCMSNRVIGALLGILLLYAAASFYYSSEQTSTEFTFDTSALNLEEVYNQHTQTETLDGWEPHIVGGQQLFARLTATESGVDVFIAYYETITGNGELVSYQHRLFDIESWSIKRQRTATVERSSDHPGFSVNSTLLTTSGGSQRWLISWYETAHGPATSGGITKLKQAADRFLGGTGGGARIILSMPVTTAGTAEDIEAALLKVASKQYGAIKVAILG